jgi:hypothetical protein
MSNTTTEETTGEVPVDMSLEACTTRHQNKQMTNCTATPVPEQWEDAMSVSQEDAMARLATVTDSEFATSLVSQFASKGTLSEKQWAWAYRIYRENMNRNRVQRSMAIEHDWKKVGSIQHYSNFVLGTYSVTNFHKCGKCGMWGQTHNGNNYSGD